MSRKGPQWERDVCTALSEWWTGGSSDAVFWRTSQSGGRATTRHKKGKETKNSHGDAWATDPVGQPLLDFASIECKRGYSKHSLSNLFDNPDWGAEQEYEKWIKKLEDTANRTGSLFWLLIVKRDRKEAVCLFPVLMWQYLRECGCSLPMYPMVRMELPSLPCVVGCVKLEDFFHLVKPGDVHRVLRRERLKGA